MNYPPPYKPAAIRHYGTTRPTSGISRSPVRVSVDDIKAALGHRLDGNPNFAAIIEEIRLLNAALDIIDERRDADGNLSKSDTMDYALKGARILPALRQLGLYDNLFQSN